MYSTLLHLEPQEASAGVSKPSGEVGDAYMQVPLLQAASKRMEGSSLPRQCRTV